MLNNLLIQSYVLTSKKSGITYLAIWILILRLKNLIKQWKCSIEQSDGDWLKTIAKIEALYLKISLNLLQNSTLFSIKFRWKNFKERNQSQYLLKFHKNLCLATAQFLLNNLSKSNLKNKSQLKNNLKEKILAQK